MDQELVAFFNERFRETSQQIQGLRDEMIRELSGLREEMRAEVSGFREEMRAEVSGFREEMRAEVSGLREEMGAEVSGLREEMGAEVSGLRKEMRAEFSGLREEMNQRFTQVDENVRHAHVRIEGVHSEMRLLAEGVIGMGEKMDTLRADVTKELRDTRSLVQDPYISLDRRVHTLETWRETKERDPLDIIRERYGKRPQT